MKTNIKPLGASSTIINETIENNTVVNEINNYYTEVTEGTGFVDPANSTLSFDDGTRIFSITPVGDSFVFWAFGTRFEKTEADTVQIDDVDALWYISYNSSGVLVASQTIWNLSTQVPVATVLWDTGSGDVGDTKGKSKPTKFKNIYIIGISIPGTLIDAQVVALHAVAGSETVKLRKRLPYSIIKCGTAPTAQADFDILVNGVSKGTATILDSVTTGSFTWTNDITLIAGDIVKVTGPVSADATLEDVAITIEGIRT